MKSCPSRDRRRFRPRLEALEDRTLPSQVLSVPVGGLGRDTVDPGFTFVSSTGTGSGVPASGGSLKFSVVPRAGSSILGRFQITGSAQFSGTLVYGFPTTAVNGMAFQVIGVGALQGSSLKAASGQVSVPAFFGLDATGVGVFVPGSSPGTSVLLAAGTVQGTGLSAFVVGLNGFVLPAAPEPVSGLASSSPNTLLLSAGTSSSSSVPPLSAGPPRGAPSSAAGSEVSVTVAMQSGVLAGAAALSRLGSAAIEIASPDPADLSTVPPGEGLIPLVGLSLLPDRDAPSNLAVAGGGGLAIRAGKEAATLVTGRDQGLTRSPNTMLTGDEDMLSDAEIAYGLLLGSTPGNSAAEPVVAPATDAPPPAPADSGPADPNDSASPQSRRSAENGDRDPGLAAGRSEGGSLGVGTKVSLGIVLASLTGTALHWHFAGRAEHWRDRDDSFTLKGGRPRGVRPRGSATRR
jgi:hypothetical protein